MFFKKLRIIRKRKKISKHRLSKELNVKPSTIYEWEHNISLPDELQLEKLSELVDVNKNDLLNEEDIKLFNSNFVNHSYKKRILKKIAFFSIIGLLVFDIFAILIHIVSSNINKSFKYIYEAENYTIDTLVCEINVKYDIDIEKIIGNSIKYDYYSVKKDENYVFSKNHITPKKIGRYDFVVDFINVRSKTKYRLTILEIRCYDINDADLINNYEDFEMMKQKPSGTFILNDDIIFPDNNSFVPIGGMSVQEKFRGIFINPNDFIIKNLNFSIQSGIYGLFRSVDDAYIDNIILEDVSITISDNGTILNSICGGLIGDATDSLITNCRVTGTVKGTYHVGGLIGEAYNSSVKYCFFDGTVNQKGDNINEFHNSSGGLIGFNDDGNQPATRCTEIINNTVKGVVKADCIASKIIGIIYDVSNNYNIAMIQNNNVNVKIYGKEVYDEYKYISQK